eukprot:COSAG06_NODE_63024_length_263_cov_0.920732_2_plen_61_part_01
MSIRNILGRTLHPRRTGAFKLRSSHTTTRETSRSSARQLAVSETALGLLVHDGGVITPPSP